MNMAIAVGAAVVVVMALMISKAAIHTFLMCVIVSTWRGFCFDMAEMAERCGEAIPERLG